MSNRRLRIEELARDLFAKQDRLTALEAMNTYGLDREAAEQLAVDHALARADVADAERALERAIYEPEMTSHKSQMAEAQLECYRRQN